MGSLVLNGNTSGSVTLAVPDVAGSNTATLPAKTGTVMIDGPAFSVGLSADQTGITANVSTRVNFNSEVFDTNNAFNNTGSTVGTAPAYSFNPQVAGYYQINAYAYFAAAPSYYQVMIYKNGSSFSQPVYNFQSGAAVMTGGSSLIYMNGSTDYVQVYIFSSSANTIAAAPSTYFQGSMVRGA